MSLRTSHRDFSSETTSHEPNPLLSHHIYCVLVLRKLNTCGTILEIIPETRLCLHTCYWHWPILLNSFPSSEQPPLPWIPQGRPPWETIFEKIKNQWASFYLPKHVPTMWQILVVLRLTFLSDAKRVVPLLWNIKLWCRLFAGPLHWGNWGPNYLITHFFNFPAPKLLRNPALWPTHPPGMAENRPPAEREKDSISPQGGSLSPPPSPFVPKGWPPSLINQAGNTRNPHN